jgi:hypothetical protein
VLDFRDINASLQRACDSLLAHSFIGSPSQTFLDALERCLSDSIRLDRTLVRNALLAHQHLHDIDEPAYALHKVPLCLPRAPLMLTTRSAVAHTE